jgi:hypothetical protein
MAVSLLASAAQAAVLYTFTGMQTVRLELIDPTGDPDGPRFEVPVNTVFTLSRPDFITNGTFTPDTCVDGNPSFTCGDMEFDNFPNSFNVGGDFLSFGHAYDDGTTSFTGGAFYFFQPGAFGAVGVYSNAGWPENGPPIGPDNGYACCFGNAGAATLVVSGSPDGAVPEPAAWALMILGFGGSGAMLRRRRRADTYAAA